MNMLIEQFDLITMYYLILLPLAFHIICYGCSDVCPTKVDLHEQILEWRAEVDASGNLGSMKKNVMGTATIVLGSTFLFTVGGKLGRIALRVLPKSLINSLTPWGKTRDLPDMPAKSFRAQYRGQERK